MRAHIYQIAFVPENVRLSFLSYDSLMHECGGKFPSERYARVYSMEVTEEEPEAIYKLLNLHHPADYTARSLSVSDVVEYERTDGSRVAYYCDTFGFQEISFDRERICMPE